MNAQHEFMECVQVSFAGFCWNFELNVNVTNMCDYNLE